jgi:hypothetical protein
MTVDLLDAGGGGGTHVFDLLSPARAMYFIVRTSQQSVLVTVIP